MLVAYAVPLSRQAHLDTVLLSTPEPHRRCILRKCSAQGATLDLVGASSFMWRQQHVAGHHVWTNVHGKDPDIRVSEADVRRVTPFQPLHPYQARHPTSWPTSSIQSPKLFGLVNAESIVPL